MEDNNQLFMQLVYILHAGAMQAMGKIKNPLTDKIERNLVQAQQSIDMLLMLRDKTKGNLSSQEISLINGMLSGLQLDYVDETKKDNKETIN